MNADHDAPRRPSPREPWPEGFKAHLVEQFQGFSPIIDRALADNGASLFRDGPYAPGHSAVGLDATAHLLEAVADLARRFRRRQAP